MAKYTYEQKLEAVLTVVNKHMSVNSVSKYLGIGYSHLRRWVKSYEAHGNKGLIQKSGSYTGEFKQHVIEFMHKKHLSIFETATIFGIPQDHTVGKWERIYYEKGPQALYENNRGGKREMSSKKPKEPKFTKKAEEEDLITEVERLRMENAYLKKLNALVQEREKSKKNTK